MARIPCPDAQDKLKELRLNQREINDFVKRFAESGVEDEKRWETMTARQALVADTLRYQLPIGMEFERAKLIMGEDYFGPQESELRLEWGMGFNEAHMGPIPFSPEELHEAKERGQYLIHRFEKNSFDDEVTIKYLRDAAPNRDGSKQMLEGLFAGIEQLSLENSTVTSGWRLADLEPQFARATNYAEAVGLALEQSPDKELQEKISKVERSILTNRVNKSVSDVALHEIATRELGHLTKYRHSMKEFYYDAIITGKLPAIIRTWATHNFITSNDDWDGAFYKIDVNLRDDGSIDTEVAASKLSDWNLQLDTFSFQRDS